MALPPPPNHPQRQAVASTLLQGVRLCIDAAVANREKLCKLLSEHGACISEEPDEDAVHVLESFCGVRTPLPPNVSARLSPCR